MKTAVKNDWANDWEAANKALGYILYTYGKDMGQGTRYPNSKEWNAHIKNVLAWIVVHCPDRIGPDNKAFVETDENHNLRNLVLEMFGDKA